MKGEVQLISAELERAQAKVETLTRRCEALQGADGGQRNSQSMRDVEVQLVAKDLELNRLNQNMVT